MSPDQLGKALAPRHLLPGLAAGLVTGVIAVTVSTAFAALIFTGSLAPYVFSGIGLMLFGSLVVGLVAGLTSSLPGLVAGIQDSAVVVMALIAANIAQAMDASTSPEAAFITIVAAIAVSTILTGASFLVLGIFKLGDLIRYIPYPVIGGFLGGSGLLLVFGALTMMMGESISLLHLAPLWDLTLVPYWLPGLGLAVALLIAVRRSDHPLIVPGVLAAATLIFFVALALAGVGLADIAGTHWFLQPLPATQRGIWRPLTWSDLALVDGKVLISQTGNLLVISLISVINLLLNASGIEMATHRDIDLNHELRIAGLANLLAGVGSGMGGCHVLSDSTLAHRMGAATRLVGVVLASVCGLILVLGGQLFSFFPMPILGGLLLFLGLDFLITWVIDVRFRLPAFDYAMILIILVVMNTAGVLAGVGLGMALAVVLFVMAYSRVDVVRYELSGADYQSRVNRPRLYRQLLRERGDWLYILELQGFLFFGTVNTLVEQVRARFADPSRAKPHFIVMDFRRVSGLDASSVLAFGRIVHLAQTHNTTLVVTHLSERCRRQLARDVFVGEQGDHWRIFTDLDHGLEWCEDRLISIFEEVGLTATPRKGAGGRRLEDTLSRAGRLGALIDFLEQAGTPAEDPLTTLVQELAPYMGRQAVEAGTPVIQAGVPPQGLYILEAGSFAVEVQDRQGHRRRVLKMQAGTIVGEAGLYSNAPASTAVVAQEPGIVTFLSRKNLQKLERDDPALAAAFHKFIAQRMSERVVDVTTTLRALLD